MTARYWKQICLNAVKRDDFEGPTLKYSFMKGWALMLL
jgi:hypothetical protein